MKEKIEVKGIAESSTKNGIQRKIITWDQSKDAYKTYEYPHDQELTKMRIREFLDDFEITFAKHLDIPEGEKEKNVKPK